MFPWLQRIPGKQLAPALPTITAGSTGFSLTVARESGAIPWVSVRKVSTFKRDLHTCDQIVLLIEVSHLGDPIVELTEECPGFASLFGPMEQVLGVDPSWYLEIMTPAFAPTPRCIYLRAQDAPTLPPGER